jgi:hypothetical protein
LYLNYNPHKINNYPPTTINQVIMIDEIIARNARKSHLLRLPAEVRNHIYEYVIADTADAKDITFNLGRNGAVKVKPDGESSTSNNTVDTAIAPAAQRIAPRAAQPAPKPTGFFQSLLYIIRPTSSTPAKNSKPPMSPELLALLNKCTPRAPTPVHTRPGWLALQQTSRQLNAEVANLGLSLINWEFDTPDDVVDFSATLTPEQRLVLARHLSSQGTSELHLTPLIVTCLLISVVYLIALCSSINTTTFCFLHVCSVLTPTPYYPFYIIQLRG